MKPRNWQEWMCVVLIIVCLMLLLPLGKILHMGITEPEPYGACRWDKQGHMTQRVCR